ncbi:DUF4360 domain-containing protein [Catenuloplanes japonicus]|uniref:DUF4360 domain-containing protein n=1 Tax=Catenuloplanes japonicus TaxID=33876 RepID=UPI000527CEBA|nr:DUF4360 domain-containing protein [Catenuloplanes japonicus]
MRHTLTIGAALLALTTTAGARTAEPATTAAPQFRHVSTAGTGCPAGSATVAITPDGTEFTVTFAEFAAETGAAATKADRERTCLISATVALPADTSVTIGSIAQRGFASLAAGAWLHRKTTYSWSDGKNLRPLRSTVKGPSDKPWAGTDQTTAASLPASPCGSGPWTFTARIDLSLEAGTSGPQGRSAAGLDSLDGSLGSARPCLAR